MLLNTDMLPTLNSVFKVALTIPVSSCSCERSFSALHRLHTYLRNTMERDWLNHLAVMSSEKENLTAVDHDKVTDRFAKTKSRRYSLTVRSRGENVKVAGSHSFSMRAGGESGAFWTMRASRRVEIRSTLW